MRANLFKLSYVGSLVRLGRHQRPNLGNLVTFYIKQTGSFWRVEPFMQTGAEVITAQVFLLEIKLRKRVSSIDDGLNSACARHVANSLYRSNLSCDVDLMRHQDEPRTVCHSTFKCGSYL